MWALQNIVPGQGQHRREAAVPALKLAILDQGEPVVLRDPAGSRIKVLENSLPICGEAPPLVVPQTICENSLATIPHCPKCIYGSRHEVPLPRAIEPPCSHRHASDEMCAMSERTGELFDPLMVMPPLLALHADQLGWVKQKTSQIFPDMGNWSLPSC